MQWFSGLFSRRRRLRDDLSEEIRLHIEERTEQLMRDGMSNEEAQRTARVAFGNRTVLEERSREVWQWPTLESVWGDVRFAMRQLCKSSGFTITAISTLALAIGANALVFGVLNALVLRPLNMPQAESLFVIQHGSEVAPHSYPDYLDLRQRNRSFDDMAAWAISQAGLDTGQDPSNVWEYQISETTSMYCVFNRTLADSSTILMSMAPTACPMSYSPTPIGTAIFRAIAT